MSQVSGGPLDRARILEVLPHRPPFLHVDRVTSYVLGERISGVREVPEGDPVFAAHFPGAPVYPGVLVIEALAQIAILLLKLDPANRGRLYVLGSVAKMHFLRPVPPGSTLELEAEADRLFETRAVFRLRASVGGQPVARGEVILGSIPHPEETP